MWNRLRSSILAKVIAWILITVAGLSLVLSAICAIVIYNEDISDKTFDEIMEKKYDEIGNYYAVRVLSEYYRMDNPGFLEQDNIPFGIIKAEDISKVDINNPNVYVKRNFTDKIAFDDVYCYEYMISANSSFYYWYDYYGLNVHAGVYDNDYSSLRQWNSYYADSINYDYNNGIFYYHADNETQYYPVKKIQLSFLGAEFVYEYREAGDESGYYLTVRNKQVGADFAEETIETNVEENAVELPLTSKDEIIEIYEILNSFEGKVDFRKLHAYNLTLKDLGKMILDDVRPVEDPAGINVIGLDRIYRPENDYRLDENFTLQEKISESEKEKNKLEKNYVLILKNDDVVASLNGNLYEQTYWLMENIYRYRYDIFTILTVSMVSFVLLFTFLMCGAGCHYNKKEGDIEIRGGLVQKLPWEIVIAVCAIAVGVLINVFFDIINSNEIKPFIIYVSVLTVCLAGWISVYFCVDFAIRVKTGRLWKSTLVRAILLQIGKVLRFTGLKIAMFYSNRDILTKFFFFFIITMIIQLFSFAVSRGFALIVIIVLDFLLCGVLFSCIIQMKKLHECAGQMSEGNLDNKVETKGMYTDFRKHGEYLNSLNAGISKAVDERMKSEHLRTELITNVSHDIKTPLTSIINYVDLLSKEDLQNEKATEYLEVLGRQSANLKKLIEDLVEASKASTGNMAVQMEKIDLNVFFTQTVGEWTERLESKQLQLVISQPESPVYINADGRHLWRVVDNLMNNIFKYAQPGSRVYINIEAEEMVVMTFRNISQYPLNVTVDELLERFVRGDKSRNTEGHGLGLSIAQSLVNLMNGQLRLYVDGDLFKVILSFKRYE